MDAFVYGTLTDPDTAREVLGTARYGPDATLVGCHRVDGEYPTLAPGGETGGRLLRTPDFAALDRYEGVGRGLYVRVAVPGPDGPVACYVGDPERLGAPADWPGSGSFAERVEVFLAGHDVRVVQADDGMTSG